MIVALAIAAIASITLLMVVAIVVAERAKAAALDRYTRILEAQLALSSQQQPTRRFRPQNSAPTSYEGGF